MSIACQIFATKTQIVAEMVTTTTSTMTATTSTESITATTEPSSIGIAGLPDSVGLPSSPEALIFYLETVADQFRYYEILWPQQ